MKSATRTPITLTLLVHGSGREKGSLQILFSAKIPQQGLLVSYSYQKLKGYSKEYSLLPSSADREYN
ncbi:UNVERIFIED_CONTAM: hypothetical protein FKN15_036198 [Acipenser sinensis]